MLWENARRNKIQLGLRSVPFNSPGAGGGGAGARGHQEAWGPFLRKARDAREARAFQGGQTPTTGAPFSTQRTSG